MEFIALGIACGLNLYVIQGLRSGAGRSTRETILDVYLGVRPFLAMMLVALALILAFPQIALWLPAKMPG